MEVDVIHRKRALDDEKLNQLETQLAVALSAIESRNTALDKTAKRLREVESKANATLPIGDHHATFFDQSASSAASMGNIVSQLQEQLRKERYARQVEREGYQQVSGNAAKQVQHFIER